MFRKDNRENKVLKELLKNNYRIFEVEEAYDLFKKEFTPNQLRMIFHVLKEKKWIRSINNRWQIRENADFH